MNENKIPPLKLEESFVFLGIQFYMGRLQTEIGAGEKHVLNILR